MRVDDRGRDRAHSPYPADELTRQAEAQRRRPLPTLDWEEDDEEDEYIEVRGIALRTVKMWVGPEGAQAH